MCRNLVGQAISSACDLRETLIIRLVKDASSQGVQLSKIIEK